MVTQQFQCGAWVSLGSHDSKRASVMEFLDPSALRSTDFCHPWDVDWCLSSWKLPSAPKRRFHLPPMVTKGTILKLMICFSKNRNELICLWPQFCWQWHGYPWRLPRSQWRDLITQPCLLQQTMKISQTHCWLSTWRCDLRHWLLVMPDICGPCSVQPHSCSVPGETHKTSPCCWQAPLHTPVEMGQGGECRNSLV